MEMLSPTSSGWRTRSPPALVSAAERVTSGAVMVISALAPVPALMGLETVRAPLVMVIAPFIVVIPDVFTNPMVRASVST